MGIEEELIRELKAEAEQLRRWANESECGGWSTHQVKAMRERATAIESLLYRVTSRKRLSVY